MRKLFGIIMILALVFTVSCKKNKHDGDYSFKINKVNLNGAKYLALGAKEGSKDDETGGFLYSVDDEGNLSIVAYEYDCDDSGVATDLKQNLTVSITAMIPVGDIYIWLMGCRYQCNNYSAFGEDMQDRIRGMVEHSWFSDFGENFLIRRSDGKIYDLNGVAQRFPIGNLKYWGGPNIPWVFDNGAPLDGELTGDRLRKLGLIAQVDNDIFLASGGYYGGLSKLRMSGDNVNVISVMPGTETQPINIAYALTDNAGHLGTCISYGSNTPHVASIMDSNGDFPAIQGIPVASGWDNSSYPEMRCVGGKYFVSVHQDWTSKIYRVDIDGDAATGTYVTDGYFGVDSGYATIYISDEDNYSWTDGATLYTFNANTCQLTSNTLPDGWPLYSEFDAEGHCYRPVMANGLTSFDIYDLATLNIESVSVDRSQVPQYNMITDYSYDGGIKAFIESAIKADGSTVTIVTPVDGPERGISRVESQTEPNNNIVVNTLIPL